MEFDRTGIGSEDTEPGIETFGASKDDDDEEGGGDGPTGLNKSCLLYTSPSPRDGLLSRMPSSA